jgi:S1-C subfamily serine protease
MRLHFLRSLTIVVLAVAIVQAEEPKCHSAARECEQQIRRMLSGRRYLGVSLVELKPGLLVVKDVIAESPAVRADLRPGDRLMAINGRPLTQAKVRDFKESLAQASNTGRVWLIILRRGAYKKVEARLEPYPKEYIDKVIAAHLAESHTRTAGTEP